jgi:hypothetical protein
MKTIELTLKISSSNDAFTDNPEEEIARILKDAAEKIRNNGDGVYSLLDINGNKIGGMDANRVLQELMGAPVRNKQMEAELRTLFELIDDEDFNQAREKIATLEKQLGEHEPELTRARSLITFLEGSE